MDFKRGKSPIIIIIIIIIILTSSLYIRHFSDFCPFPNFSNRLHILELFLDFQKMVEVQNYHFSYFSRLSKKSIWTLTKFGSTKNANFV